MPDSVNVMEKKHWSSPRVAAHVNSILGWFNVVRAELYIQQEFPHQALRNGPLSFIAIVLSEVSEEEPGVFGKKTPEMSINGHSIKATILDKNVIYKWYLIVTEMCM